MRGALVMWAEDGGGVAALRERARGREGGSARRIREFIRILIRMGAENAKFPFFERKKEFTAFLSVV